MTATEPRDALPVDIERDSPIGRWALLVIAIAAIVPYLRVLDAPFVFDDIKLVRDNELLRVEGEGTFDRVLASFNVLSREFDERDVRENYRPLRFLSYLVDYRLSRWWYGDEFSSEKPPAAFFHLQNILWHALNAVLVCLIGRRLLGSEFGGLFLGLVFALHPIATEAVTYVSGRRDVLSTFCFLGALALYLRYGARERLGVMALVGAPCLLALGFLSKEMVATLPALLLLIEIVRRPRIEICRIACHFLLWGVTAWFIYATLANEGLVATPVAKGAENVALTAPRLVARYCGLLVAPFSQSLDYSFDVIPVTRGLFAPWTTAASLAGVVAALGVSIWAFVKRRGLVVVGVLWFLGTLAPVLQIVPIPERFAERFVYLPALGVFLLVAALLVRVRRFEPVLGWAVAVVLTLVLFGLSTSRNGDWQTRVALWRSAVDAQPRCARAWSGYGEALQMEGAYRDAEAAYSHALDIWAEEADPPPLRVGHALRARTARGAVRFVIDELEGAEKDFAAVLASTDSDGTVIAESPSYARVRFDYAGVLLKQGRLADAEREYRTVIRVGGPAGAVSSAWLQIAQMALATKDVEKAIEYYRESVAAMEPDERGAVLVLLSLADLLEEEKDHDAAWEVLEDALRRDPNRDERVGILLRMARVLDKQGQLDSCVEHLERALDIDDDNIHVLVTLGGIEMNRERYERAEAAYRHVLRMQPRNRQALQGLNQLRMRRDVERQGDAADDVEKELRGRIAGAEKNLEAGKLILARKAYDEVLRLAGQVGKRRLVVEAYWGIARAESLLGQDAGAQRALEQALRLEEARWESWRRLGDLELGRLGRPDAALESYHKYLALLPADEKADPRVYVNLAQLVVKADPREALSHYESAMKLGAREVLGARVWDVERRIGLLRAELGQWQQAFDVLSRWVLEAPEEVTDDVQRESVRRFLDREVVPHLLKSGDS